MAKLKSKDALHLVPNWRFFAPVPARRDYHLEYRVKTTDLQITRWKRIAFYKERTLLSLVWYPDKRFRKAFNTSVRRITRSVRDHGFETAARSLSYMHLLNYLQARHLAKSARQLQYRIVSSQDFADDPRIRLVFTSSWHQQAKPLK
jgi:hypothetical protein